MQQLALRTVVAGFVLLSSAMMVYIYQISYIPPARTGTSEIIDFYIQSWNLAKTPSYQSSFLPAFSIHEPGSTSGVTIYTHGPNAHRIVGSLLILAGIKNIQDILILSCIIGIVFAAVASLVYMRRSTSPWTICLLLILFMVDYTTFDQMLNPYRVWHYGLFIMALSASISPVMQRRRFTIWVFLSAFFLFAYEYVFAVFTFVACCFTAMTARASYGEKARFAAIFTGGAALSIVVSLVQLTSYFGSFWKIVEEARKVVVERNTVLYADQPLRDTSVVPANFGEYLEKFQASIIARYPAPLLRLVEHLRLLLYGLAVWFVLDRGMWSSGWHILKASTRHLVRMESVRIAIGCLLGVVAVGFVSRGFVSHMYFTQGLPMVNLAVFSMLAALVHVIHDVIRAILVHVQGRWPGLTKNGRLPSRFPAVGAALVAGVISMRMFLDAHSGWPTYEYITSANYGDRDFYVLEQHATRGTPVATDAGWPIIGVIHGLTGRFPVPLADAAEVPDAATRTFSLFLCYNVSTRCGLDAYGGPYTILEADAQFILVALGDS